MNTNHCAYESQHEPKNIKVQGLRGCWDGCLHAVEKNGAREYWWVLNADGVDGEEGYWTTRKAKGEYKYFCDAGWGDADNAITRDLSGKAVGRARLFSRQEEVADGAFVRGGAIWLRDAAGEREVLPLADIRLPGWHNVENYMAALLAVDGLVRDETVRRVAREFAGVEHRIEFVRELHGVRYYNDSIATSPTRTIAGLRAFPHKVVLIAGGYDKHIPFAPLAPEVVEHVKTLILCGATADAIERAVVESEVYETAAERPRILRCKDLREAVDAAYSCAESGDVVTLSPACAAFDCYANFMERGRAYKEMVKKLGE